MSVEHAVQSWGGTPELAHAAAQFPGFSKYPIDSVYRSDSAGMGHREGRAVDVGVPDNEAGFYYVSDAAKSGAFASIGTNPAWIPELQKYYPNVNFFEDYDQVHAHLEVGAWEH